LRLVPKETSYKANNLQYKNKSKNNETDESFVFQSKNKTRRKKQIAMYSTIVDENDMKKIKPMLKHSFLHARTELDSMRINTKYTNNEKDYFMNKLKDVDEETIIMNTSASKPSCNCVIF